MLYTLLLLNRRFTTRSNGNCMVNMHNKGAKNRTLFLFFTGYFCCQKWCKLQLSLNPLSLFSAELLSLQGKRELLTTLTLEKITGDRASCCQPTLILLSLDKGEQHRVWLPRCSHTHTHNTPMYVGICMHVFIRTCPHTTMHCPYIILRHTWAHNVNRLSYSSPSTTLLTHTHTHTHVCNIRCGCHIAHTHIYTPMCVHICICTYTCIHTCMHIHTHTSQHCPNILLPHPHHLPLLITTLCTTRFTSIHYSPYSIFLDSTALDLSFHLPSCPFRSLTRLPEEMTKDCTA